MSQSHKNVVISGYYGFGNFGDEAILNVLVEALRDIDEKINITVLSKNPLKTSEALNVNSVDRMKMYEVFNQIYQADLFISGGGSLLQDKTSFLTIYYYLLLIMFSNIFSKQTYIFANGIGPIDKLINRFLTGKILKKAARITVRDKKSFQLLEELGVNSELTKDPVWTGVKPVISQEILGKYKINICKKIVGINLRHWSEVGILEVEQLARSIIKHFSDGYQILIMPVHYQYDKSISEDLLSFLRSFSSDLDVIMIEEELSPALWAGIIDLCENIIAMRFHVIMLAAINNKEVFAISYDPKVKTLAEELDASYITIEDWKKKLIDSKIASWKSNFQNGSSYVADLETLSGKARRNFDILSDLLKD